VYNGFMAAIDFPNNPVDGQEFSAGGRIWIWNEADTVWKAAFASQQATGDGIDPNIFLLMGA
jgi:hypothetical protein